MDGQRLTFKGYCTFNEGVISNGPAIFFLGDNTIESYRLFMDGRAPEASLVKMYVPQDANNFSDQQPMIPPQCILFRFLNLFYRAARRREEGRRGP